ncbi:hypothetical protein CsSME_00046264 [Camellia sinensis var. sinensis]
MRSPKFSIDLENPVIDVTPSPLTGYTSSSHGSKVVLLCERVQVAGQSRLELGSYASAYQVKLVSSVVIPKKLHNKIQICFHHSFDSFFHSCLDDFQDISSDVLPTIGDGKNLMEIIGFSKMASLLSCFWFCFIAVGTSGQQLGSLLL